MHLLSTYLPPSAVSHAVKCNLGQELLIIARINRLECLQLLPDGARPLCSLELLPRIVALHEITLENGPNALLVITSYPDCSALIVEYSAEQRALVVKETHKLLSPYGLPLVGCNTCAVSADCQYAAISLYQGIMHILQFTRKSGSVQVSLKFECPIPELLLSSFCFTPRINGELMIALLHRAHTGRRHIVTRRIDEINKELPLGSESWILGDDDFKSLIPILPSQGGYGGLLVLGEDNLIFYELTPPKVSQSPRRMRKQSIVAERKADVTLDWNYSAISGWGFVENDRLLLSDKYGKLLLLTMIRSRESRKIQSMAIDDLGESSSAKCIAYINAGVIFLGSENGDSHLLQLTSSGRIEVVETYKNVGPIADAALADLDASGEPAIVTCSGGGKTGSLRIIRSGANLEELVRVAGTEAVKNIFPLCGPTDQYHSHLILSFHAETKLVETRQFSEYAEVPQAEFPGLVRDQATLAAANIVGKGDLTSGLAVQVTSAAVVLFDLQSGLEVDRWSNNITLANIFGDTISVALVGCRAAIITVDTSRSKLVAGPQKKFHSEISAISIQPFSVRDKGPSYVFLGFWEDYTVRICHIGDLEAYKQFGSIEMPHVPRSILASSFRSGTQERNHLFVGLGNGKLVSLRLNGSKLLSDTNSRRTISLGDRAVHVHRCLVDNNHVVMASGSRSVLLSWSNGRIQQHHVNIKTADSVAEFNSINYPNSLVFKIPSGVIIGKIGKLEKLKIDSVSLGYDVPVSVDYHPGINAFALGCVRTEPSRPGAPDIITSSFKLLDALTFEHVNSYGLGSNEEVVKVSVEELAIDGIYETYIVVGTAIWEDNGGEPSKGRVLLFRTQSGKPRPPLMNPSVPSLLLCLDQEITGSVVNLRAIQGDLAVIVNSVLIVYRLERHSVTQDLEFKPIDQWVHGYLLWSLVVVPPSFVVVGDAAQSVAVLRWTGANLEFVAKDYAAINSMNITADDDFVVQSDIDSNISSYTMDKAQQKGHYYFSETISLMMPGSLHRAETINESLPKPKHLLFTPGGRISVLSQCQESDGLLLHNVQRNLNAALKKEYSDVLSWRAPQIKPKFASDDVPQSYGFIDGDLLSRFLELEPDSSEVEKVLKGTREAEKLDQEYTELRSLIEELHAMQ
ncbi:hypothetical protein CPB86DRAFT_765387 [Serendipita vermifera]|nr:hypothetical protein CPB86DRAFT_765387 [Serendipita vermifera]